jgi:hypothetical protein
MITAEQEAIYLEIIEKNKRKNEAGKITPTQEEIEIVVKQAQNGSKYFKDVLDQIAEYGDLYPNVFVYVLNAIVEEENKQRARDKSIAPNDIPDEGETITLFISVASVKNMSWKQITSKGRTEIRNSIGIIAYAGEYEVFFWGAAPKVQSANIQERQMYRITGQVKSIDSKKMKMELIRISSVVPIIHEAITSGSKVPS